MLSVQELLAKYEEYLFRQGLSATSIERKLSSVRAYLTFIQPKKKSIFPRPTTTEADYQEKLAALGIKVKERKSIWSQLLLVRLTKKTLKTVKTLPFSLSYALKYRRPAWLIRYQKHPASRYLNLGFLVLVCVLLGIAGYQQIDKLAAKKGSILGSVPVSMPQYLSFQGRLTDSSGNPITAETHFRFSIYNDPVASGSAQLYEEAKWIEPDQDGIFNTLIGDTTTLPASLFKDNPALWLGITVNENEEMTDRQQIATVAYAFNSQYLQGYGVGATNVGANVNEIPVIDNQGRLMIAAAGPTLQTTSGTFKIESPTLALMATVGSGNVGIGTSNPSEKLDVAGNINVSGTGIFDTIKITGLQDTGNSLGTNGQILTSTGTGVSWGSVSDLTVGNADTLDGLDSTAFLRSNEDDSFESGKTLTIDGTLDINGNLSIADTDIAFDGSSTNFTTTGNFSINSSQFSLNQASGNVGIGTTNPTQKLDVNGNLNVGGTGFFSSTKVGILLDKDSQPGNNAQVLSSTGTGVDWVDISSIGIGGSGITNFLPKFLSSTTLGISSLFDNGTNVGVGTTNPLANFHVEGQCVAEGTLIRRKSKSKSKSKDDEWEDVPVEDIMPGDEVLTFNEQTGEFVWQTVEKTMNKGIQTVYEIVTSGQKRIQITDQHPLFVIDKPKITSGTFEVDLSIHFGNLERPTQVAIAKGNSVWVGTVDQTVKKEIKKLAQQSGKTDLFQVKAYAQTIVAIFQAAGIYPQNILIDRDYTGLEQPIRDTIKETFAETEVDFDKIADNSLAHIGSWQTNKKKRKSDFKLELESSQIKSGQGSHKANLRAVSPGVITEIRRPHDRLMGKGYHENSFLSSGSFSKKDLQKGYWVKEKDLHKGQYLATANGWEKITGIREIGQKQTYDLQISNTHNFVANGIVAHNTYINGNVGIGTTGNKNKLDINGSLAVGSYAGVYTAPSNSLIVSGNIGIGTTSPGANIDISATSGNLIRGSYGTTQVFSVGSTGNFWLKPSNAATVPFTVTGASGQTGHLFDINSDGITGGNLITILASGNLGIGTTNPTQKLDVNGNLNVGGTGFFASTKVGRLLDAGSSPGSSNMVLTSTGTGVSWGNISDVIGEAYESPLTFINGLTRVGDTIELGGATALSKVTAINQAGYDFGFQGGNVGIGTTSPTSGYKLDVVGNLRVGNTGYIAGNLNVGNTANFAYLTASRPVKTDANKNLVSALISLTSDITGVLGLANGGTNKDLSTHTTYGLTYLDADSFESLATGTSGQLLMSNGNSSAPIWTNLSSLPIEQPLTFSNGLTRTVNDVHWGGQLSELTKIDMNSNNIGFWGTGNVGIGTTNPSQKLDINGNLNVGGSAFIGSNVRLSALTTSRPLKLNENKDIIATQIDLGSANDITGILGVAYGGTNINGSTAPNGSLLIGNGTGYTLANLTAGTAVTITNSSGGITLSHTDTSSQASSSNNDGTVIQNITLDDLGHLTGLASVNLDNRYLELTDNLWVLGADSGTPYSVAVGSTANILGGAGLSSSLSSNNLTLAVGAGVGVSVGPNDISINQAYNFSWTGTHSWSNTATFTNDVYLPGSSIWNSSGNVGIGTTSPTSGYKLDVAGNLRVGGTAYFISRVGIGTTAPTEALDINGDLKLSGVLQAGGASSGLAYHQFGTGSKDEATITDADDVYISGDLEIDGTLYAANISGVVSGSGTPNMIARFTGTGDTVGDSNIYDNGNIGIGTTNPTQKLDVNGSLNVGGTGIFGSLRLTGAFYDVNNQTGTNGQVLSSTGSSVDWVDPATLVTNYWQRNGTVLSPATYGDHITTSGNVGIGSTAAPINKLDVYGGVAIGSYAGVYTAASNNLIISGNIGLGITSPTQKLDVDGNIRIASGYDLYLDNIRIGATGSSNSTAGAYKIGTFDEFVYSDSQNVQDVLDDLDLKLGEVIAGEVGIWYDAGTAIYPSVAGPTSLSITDAGNIGIGTTSPSQKFQINSSESSAFVVTSSGSVGAGTTNPTAGYKVDIEGNLRVGNTANLAYLIPSRPVKTDANNNLITALIDLTSSNDVTGILPISFGGTGLGTTPSSGQLLIGQSDGTYNLSTLTAGAGIGLTNASGSITIGHSDTSSQASSDNSGTTVIQDITLDDFGHLVGIGTTNLAGVFESPLTFTNGLTRTDNTIKWGGTLSELTKIDLNSNNFGFYGTGNVGIGTTSPTQLLDINGNLRLRGALFDSIGAGSSGTAGQVLVSTGIGVSWADASGQTYTASNGLTLDGTDFQLGGTLSKLTKIDLNGNDFGFYGTGNVGIGTTNPTAKLELLADETYSTMDTNIVANGTFDTDLSSWTYTADNWVWDTGKARHVAGNITSIQQSLAITAGDTYEITVTLSDLTADTCLQVRLGGEYSNSICANGTINSIVTTSTTENLIFTPSSSAFNGSLDNVTVKKIHLTPPLLKVSYNDGWSSVEIRPGGGTFVGRNSGQAANIDAYWNAGFGEDALFSLIDGFENIAVGAQALYSNTSGYDNTAVGVQALVNNFSGYYNTALGYNALTGTLTGAYNVALGAYTGTWNNGSNNVFIGYAAGDRNETGNGNVFLGYQAGYYEMGSNKLYIENSDSNNPLIWGDFSTDTLNFNGNVGIGTTNPTAKLTIQGNSSVLLGSELVTNGAFVSDLSGWTTNASDWTWSSGTALHTTGNTSPLYQGISVTQNKVYRLGTFTLSSTAGSVTVGLGSSQSYTFSGSSTSTVYFTAGTTGTVNLTFTPTSDFDGAIDFISVKEIVPDTPLLNGSNSALSAGLEIRSGNFNTYLGYQSGLNTQIGGDNTSLGYQALRFNVAGDLNVAVGEGALYSNLAGDENIALGFQAGYSNLTGSGNLFLGYQAGYYEMGSNKLYIENSDSNNPLIWGDFSTDTLNFNGNVGIGTTDPLHKLELADHTTAAGGIGFGSDVELYRGAANSLYLASGDSLNLVSGNLSIGGSANITDNLAINLGVGETVGDNKLYVGGNVLITGGTTIVQDLRLNGNQILNSAGTATIMLSSTPTTSWNTLDAGAWKIQNTANLGQAALAVIQDMGGDIFTASASGQTKFVIKNNGNVGIGTANPAGKLEVVNGNALFGEKVGIGTQNPQSYLDVYGDAIFRSRYNYFQLPVTITNSTGSTQTDYDVLIEKDTNALIAAGKMNADCSDVRFIDGSNELEYWIEQGCNTTKTQFWVRIPSLPTGDKEITMVYGNPNSAPGQVNWNGNFIVMSKDNCPSGWNNNQTIGSNYVMGSSVYGLMGSGSHNHTISGNTNDIPSTTFNFASGSTRTIANSVHYHSYDTTSSTVDNLPPYIEMNFCESNNPGLLNSNLVIFFNQSLPPDWSNYSALNQRFPRGVTVGVGTTGGGAHQHSASFTTGGASASSGNDGTGFPGPHGTHTHSSGTFYTSNETANPPYINLNPANIGAGNTSVFPQGAITAFDTPPPFGWTRFSQLDNRFPMGNNTDIGTTGGTTTHTHTYSGTTDGPSLNYSNNDGGNTRAGSNHTHTFSGTSGEGSSLPSYYTLLYYQKNTMTNISVSFGSESDMNNSFVSLFIADNGQIAIGNSNPASLFDVNHYLNVTNTGNVGIGITNPQGLLHLSIGDTTPLFVSSQGNVGIGTMVPAVKLEVAGNTVKFGASTSNISTTDTLILGSRDTTYGHLNINYVGAGDTGVAASNIDFKPRRMDMADSYLAARIGFLEQASVNQANIFFSTNDGTGIYERMRINSSGNVGIGTTSPTTPLDVNGLIRVRNPQGETTAPTRSNNGEFAFAYVDSNYRLYFRTNGVNRVINSSGAGDFSEYFLKENPQETLTVGTIMTDETGRVQKAWAGSRPLGVVSAFGTQNYNTADGDRHLDHRYVNVGLLGHLPIIVTSENGPIALGDKISAESSIPGLGTKASDKPQNIVGSALQGFNPDISCPVANSLEEISWPADIESEAPPDNLCFRLPNGLYVGKIMTYVNVSWYDPDVLLTDTGNIYITNANYDGTLSQEALENQGYSLLTASGETVTRLANFAEAAIAKVKAGFIQTTNLVADYVLVNQKLVSPIIETRELTADGAKLTKVNTDFIAPQSGNDLVISLSSYQANNQQDSNPGGVGKLIVKGDSEFTGNVGIGQTLETKDASISGELYAESARIKKLRAESIEGLEAIFATMSALLRQDSEGQANNIEDARSVSDTINNVSGLEDQISSASGDLNLTDSLIATDSSLLEEMASSWPITNPSDDVKIESNVSILGVTTLAQTIVSGPLTQDGTLLVDNGNSINVLGGTLYLQNQGGGLDLLAGKVTIDPLGNTVFEGNLTVKATLFAGLVKPLDGGDLTIDLSHSATHSAEPASVGFGRLLTKGANGETVFSLDASGSAQFTGEVAAASFKIARDAVAAEPDIYGVIEATSSAGLAKIPAGSYEVTIKSPYLKEKSLIYLTPVGSTDNQVIYLARTKPEEQIFTAAIDRALTTKDILFSWWIVN